MTDRSTPNIRVVGISGSLRDGSYTRQAVQVALRGAAELGAATRLLDLRDYALMFSTGRVDEETCPPDVLRLRRDLRAAQGIILGTPEYHASFSGVLKNALDLMGFEEFEGKMLGLVGVSGGRLGAINALNSLRMVGRALARVGDPGAGVGSRGAPGLRRRGKAAGSSHGRRVCWKSAGRWRALRSCTTPRRCRSSCGCGRRRRLIRAQATRPDGDPAARGCLRDGAGPVCRHPDFGGQDVRVAAQRDGWADASRLSGDAACVPPATAQCDHVRSTRSASWRSTHR